MYSNEFSRCILRLNPIYHKVMVQFRIFCRAKTPNVGFWWTRWQIVAVEARWRRVTLIVESLKWPADEGWRRLRERERRWATWETERVPPNCHSDKSVGARIKLCYVNLANFYWSQWHKAQNWRFILHVVEEVLYNNCDQQNTMKMIVVRRWR